MQEALYKPNLTSTLYLFIKNISQRQFIYNLYYNEVQMSLISSLNPLDSKIREIETQTYVPHKSINCHVHHLPNNHTCLHQKCIHYCAAICPQCHPSNLNHSLINITKIVPKLAQWAKDQWRAMQKDHKKIESEWKVCLVNINYCLDILKEVKKQIQERSQSVELSIFKQLLENIYGMFRHDSNNLSSQMMLKTFKRLNDKYSLLGSQDKAVNSQHSQQERQHKKAQVTKASHKTKEFTQSALLFSQNLARIIQEKLKVQKRMNRLKQITNSRIYNLKDLLKQEAKVDQIDDLMIQLPKSQTKQNKDDQPIDKMIQKCGNLRLLRINNRNGNIQKKKWIQIYSGMDYLKNLKELVLHIKASDLNILIELFKDKKKVIRQIQKLTLLITDQKELLISDVYNFLNTMQLRTLNLTLARDNLKKTQIVELLQKTRLTSSMTNLPFSELNINLNKNKITQGIDHIQITKLFNFKADSIKNKSIVF